MAGYAGKLLRVNLTQGQAMMALVVDDIARDFIGGRGFGIKYLYDEIEPGVEPLSPDNKLILLNGPLAGTNSQSFSRWIATTKSPLTGTYTRAVGGADFGAWLKFVGLDLIIVEGKAQEPVYVYIENDRCEIRDASKLWGKGTAETQEELRQVHGTRIRTACIGPGGENLVRYAVIASDRRTASRGGVGTVMGSKKLKAVVLNPSPQAIGHVELHDPKTFKGETRKQIELYRANPSSFEAFCRHGTLRLVRTTNDVLGIWPVRNFRYGKQDDWEKLSAEEYDKLRNRHTGCYSCMLKCGKIHTKSSGPYAGATSEGPEYESTWAFAGTIDNTDIGATILADKLCDDIGIDTISAGSTIGFAYELFGKGILTTGDTDGLELTYGNHEAMITLVKKIGFRQGLGELLAEGSFRTAKRIGKGAEEYVMQVKGQEIPAYDPRGAKAHGLSYATSNVGANHSVGYAIQEIFGSSIPRAVKRFDEEGKGEITKFNQDRIALYETGIACVFPVNRNWIPYPTFANLLTSATGIAEFGDVEYLEKVGERIYNLERAFNVRAGFDRKDDYLPMRLLTEPLKKGASEGHVVKDIDRMLDEYYDARGWTRDGIPTAHKLEELGLGFVIEIPC